MTWNAGYVTDIDYLHGYVAELNPLHKRLAFLAAGLASREPKTACELGFGQGLSVNIHAAASSVDWWGTDFNPAQAGFARQLVEGAGSGARLFDEAFAEFCIRPDLPNFDFIGLHGIWSWISDGNKAVLVDFIRRRLNPDGVLYIGYNTNPGWAAFVPVRHLMKLHNDVMSAPGRNIITRIEGAIEFAERLLDTDPHYLRANPNVSERLKQIKNWDRRYLVHEYLNANWQPMHVAELAKWLEPTRCTFACSSQFVDHINAINFTPAQQDLLRDISDSIFQEGVKDFLINRWFRKDYWAKGLRRLSRLEHNESLRDERIVLITSRAEAPPLIAGARYKVPESAYARLLDMLADNRPKSFAELEQDLKMEGLTFAQMLESILLLAGAGHIQPAQTEDRAEEATASTNRLNTALIHKARGDASIGSLASPVTGGGIAVSRFEQLFLLARRNGRSAPEDRAAFTWSILQEQAERLVKEGKTIGAAEDNLATLAALARNFADKREPILNALGIA